MVLGPVAPDDDPLDLDVADFLGRLLGVHWRLVRGIV
jgi:hypothetical protein